MEAELQAVPPIPTNVQTIVIGPGIVAIKWDPANPADNVTGYIVNYQTTGLPTQTINTVLPQAILSDLALGTTYTATVQAISTQGGVTDVSNPSTGISATTLSTPFAQNLWDLPHAIYANPANLSANDIDSFMTATNLNDIFLLYVDYISPDPLPGCINAINAQSGNTILSFNVNPHSIESTSTNLADVIAFYEDKINSYNLGYINFTCGTDFFNLNNAVAQHIATLTQLFNNNPTLKISYTLQVDSLRLSSTEIVTGLNYNSQNFLQNLQQAGIIPSLINARTTDYAPVLSTNLLQNIETSIDGSGSSGLGDVGLAAQLTSLWPSVTNVKAMIGIAPVFGQNAIGNVFTPTEQTNLNQYAASGGIANLNGFSASTDMNPWYSGLNQYDFSTILVGYNG